MANRDTSWESRVGRRLKLRDLHILAVVVRCGSMGRAAGHLGMSQAALSESIANLEDAVRVRLLDRNHKGVTPTLYARALLDRGHVVFDELQQALRDIEFLADPKVGEVRVGCPESLMAGFVPAIIDKLSQRYPHIVTHVVNAQPGEQDFQQLRERSVDLTLGRVLAPLRDPDIDMELLCEDRFFVVAGANNPWVGRRKLSFDQIAQGPWVMFPKNSVIALHLSKAMEVAGLALPRESVTSFSMHVRMHLLATGRYLTIMHGSTLRYYAKPWSLKALPIDLPIPAVPIAVFTLRKRTLSPVASLYIEQTRMVSKALCANFPP